MMQKDKFIAFKQQAYKAEHSLTGHCEVCGKEMMKKDEDYSLYKYNKVVCIEDSPMTAVRPQEEVKVEEKFLEEEGLESIPF